LAELQRISPRWTGELCVVAAPGPSLTPNVAERCRGNHAIAVQDAWRLLPWADVLYGCESIWWQWHNGCPGFSGERWSSHDSGSNYKLDTAQAFGLRLVRGHVADGFSADPSAIHYGGNSGFQAINLALLFGAARVVLVGFDMRTVDGKRHFFGGHPPALHRGGANYSRFIPDFERAAAVLPPGVEILNATPGSALTCFPMVSLDDSLSDPPRRRPAGELAAADRAGAS
jgi:hypothetical protein